MTRTIVWFRRDLRLADHPALCTALTGAERVIPVYISTIDEVREWAPGGAGRWWLHHSLASLGESLAARGSRLILRRGPAAHALRELARETGARRVYWHRLYEPDELACEHDVSAALAAESIEACALDTHTLFAPETVRTQGGTPYRVFTPFLNRCLALHRRQAPLAAPRALPPVDTRIASLALAEFELLPRLRWDSGLHETWQPGEAGARKRLAKLPTQLDSYADARDQPAADATSRLSSALHFGELSPRLVLERISPVRSADARKFRDELYWREFAHHVLFHHPRTANQALDERYADFPWRDDPALLRAWQRGETGFPIVDAGMRELWRTGFMHNRVRMIVASFLTKHARLPWLDGARWFWDTLVDADLAANTLNWQWVAGCGADAAPYFRIFNPVKQSERFDEDGDYLRRWLPELARMPARWIHAPWTAPANILTEAGVKLGGNYPLPVLDLDDARRAALAAFERHMGRHATKGLRRNDPR